MKGFGYDGAAHSGPCQSVTPKLVVCLLQGGLQSFRSPSVRNRPCRCISRMCVCAACIRATLLSGEASVSKAALAVHAHFSAAQASILHI